MTNNEITNQIDKLESKFGAFKSKCLRNLRLYTYSPNITLDNSDSSVVGYYDLGTFDVESDTTSSIQENIIQSIIDTLSSIVASQKVRPFFSTVNGTTKEQRAVMQAQIFFDQLYEENNINKVVSLAFRDACIFDKGIVKIGKQITRVNPWNFYINPAEWTYTKKLTQCVERFPKMPGRIVNRKYNTKLPTNIEYTVYEYYDTLEKVKAVYIREKNLVIKETWNHDIIPYQFIFYSEPLKSFTSQSVTDQLYGIQMQIDDILSIVKDSIQMNPGVTYFVPTSSNIKTSMLTNRTGQIIEYDAIQGQSGSPITSQLSDIISPQFIQLLEKLKEDAYELIGISQLSASMQKPQGVDSGKALQTLDNIESDRHEILLTSIINLYIDIAKALIELYDEEESILPPSPFRSKFTWKDIVDAKDNMSIQFSAAQSLSKDPSTKLQQLIQLKNEGVIPQYNIARLMEMPDITAGSNAANNAFDAVQDFIGDLLDSHKVPSEIPVYLPTDMLSDEILNTILSLSKNKENKNDIELLLVVYNMIDVRNRQSTTNAEYAAIQSLNQEITAALPQIEEESAKAVQEQLETQ